MPLAPQLSQAENRWYFVRAIGTYAVRLAALAAYAVRLNQ